MKKYKKGDTVQIKENGIIYEVKIFDIKSVDGVLTYVVYYGDTTINITDKEIVQ